MFFLLLRFCTVLVFLHNMPLYWKIIDCKLFWSLISLSQICTSIDWVSLFLIFCRSLCNCVTDVLYFLILMQYKFCTSIVAHENKGYALKTCYRFWLRHGPPQNAFHVFHMFANVEMYPFICAWLSMSTGYVDVYVQ